MTCSTRFSIVSSSPGRERVTCSDWPLNTAAAIFVLLFWANAAFACGVCVTAAVDTVLPPAHVWSLFALSWFVAHGLLRSWTGASLPLQPRLAGSLLIAAAAVMVGGAALGPLVVLPLAIPPVVAVVKGVRTRSGFTPRVRHALIASGVAGTAVAVFLGIWSGHELRTRTEAEFIAEWSGTAVGRARFLALQPQEPESLTTYRQLLQIGNSTLVGNTAERVGVIGVPGIDIPLLETALERVAADDDAARQVGQALRQLHAKPARPD